MAVWRHRRGWGLVPLILAAAVWPGGCGSDEAVNESAAQTADLPASSSADIAPPPPPPPAHAAKVELRRFYGALNLYDYRAAWQSLDPELRAALGGFTTWRSGYGTNLWTKVTDVDTISASPTQVVLAVDLRAQDEDACDDLVNQTFSGAWTLERRPAGGWMGTSISLDKTGGGEVVLDAADCSVPYVPPEPTPQSYVPPPPAPPSTSYYADPSPYYEPNPYDSGTEYGDPGYYSSEAGDIDCDDVYGSMPTPYDDPNNLDADNDGMACE